MRDEVFSVHFSPISQRSLPPFAQTQRLDLSHMFEPDDDALPTREDARYSAAETIDVFQQSLTHLDVVIGNEPRASAPALHRKRMLIEDGVSNAARDQSGEMIEHPESELLRILQQGERCNRVHPACNTFEQKHLFCRTRRTSVHGTVLG